jgi:uncharacterized protein YeaC (DUF1315 family)
MAYGVSCCTHTALTPSQRAGITGEELRPTVNEVTDNGMWIAAMYQHNNTTAQQYHSIQIAGQCISTTDQQHTTRVSIPDE